MSCLRPKHLSAKNSKITEVLTFFAESQTVTVVNFGYMLNTFLKKYLD